MGNVDFKKGNIDISIIIVSYNAKEYLRNCLYFIYSNRHIVNFETIVVDNNSIDKSPEMVKREFPQVRLIENKENIGFARANNIALRESQGRYILLLNNDTILLPDSLDIMTIIMENSPTTGVLGCQLMNTDESLQESFNRIPDIFTEFIRKSIYNQNIGTSKNIFGKYLYRKYQMEQDVDWVTGSCMMIRRNALVDIGLLDEKFFMYFEDVDLCCRIREKGWKIKYTPSAKVIHVGGRSVLSNAPKANLEYRLSQLYFYKKYHGMVHLQILKMYLLAKLVYNINICIWHLIFKKERNRDKVEEIHFLGRLFVAVFRYS
ncbi:MAG: glycosyltransferase family 2 protein [Nitrospinota bacterium]